MDLVVPMFKSDTYPIDGYITIADTGVGCGFLSIISTYGSWSYFWGAIGSDIRTFLCKTDTAYLRDKLTYDSKEDRDVLNISKTIKAMKKSIIESRSWGYDAVLARELYDQTKELEDCYFDHEFYTEFEAREDLFIYFCGGVDLPTVTEYSVSINQFFEKVWPKFIETIKGE